MKDVCSTTHLDGRIQEHGGFVCPATRYIPQSVTSPAENEKWDVVRFDELYAVGVSFNRQIKAAESIA
jgi:hypothetical protein